MSSHLLDDARAFLVNSLAGRHNASETKHPWRRDWEFAVLHSLRVESYALKILAREDHSLSDREIILLRLAAILHDIARLDRRENHAELGAEIAKNWLLEYSNDPLKDNEVATVVEMIADHSHKDVHEPGFSKGVLKDADTLDEIGAMSIFMTSNWLEHQSPFFFYDLRQRLVDFELPYCDRKFAALNTEGGREILREKRAFVEKFVSQLTDELHTDAYTEHMLRRLP